MKKEKEKNNKKKIIIGLGIVCLILLIIAIVFLVMFLIKPTYKVTVNTGGGKITRDIVIKDNVVKELPEITPPKDKVLVAWVNKDNEAVRPNIKLTNNDTFTPVFEEEKRETVTLKFESGTDEKIPNIIITKGTTVILPVKPYHDTWKFLYWVDKDGFIVLNNRVITEDTTFYAYWFKPTEGGKNEEVTIKFDTGTDEKIDDIKLIKGSNLIFPTLKKKKDKMVFRGWLDEDGNLLTNSSKAEKDMTLKANWKETYTCPENCEVIGDGSTCNKTDYKDVETYTGCPAGYSNMEGHCVDVNDGGSAYGEFGNYTGECPAGYYKYTEIWGLSADLKCAREVSKTTTTACPDGYTLDNDKCKKVETINCTAN